LEVEAGERSLPFAYIGRQDSTRPAAGSCEFICARRPRRIFWADELCCNASIPIPHLHCWPRRSSQVLMRKFTSLKRTGRRPPRFDAWQAYHRGRAHMYRFTSDSNREAQQFFTRAIALDPTFSPKLCGVIVHAYFLVVSSNQRQTLRHRGRAVHSKGRHSLTSSRNNPSVTTGPYTSGQMAAKYRQIADSLTRSDPLRRDRGTASRPARRTRPRQRLTR